MKILIYEPHWKGHFPYYLELTFQAIRDNFKNSEIVWLAPGAESCDSNFYVFLKKWEKETSLKVIPVKKIHFLGIIQTLYQLVLHFVCQKADVLFIPTLDNIMSFSIPLFFLRGFKTRTIAVLHNPNFVYPEIKQSVFRVWIKWLFFHVFVINDKFVSLSFVNDVALDRVRFKIKDVRKLFHLADPVPKWGLLDKVSVRRALGLNGNKKILLAFGYLSIRKGVDALIKTFSDLSWDHSWMLLLVGTADQDILKLLSAPDVNDSIQSGRITLRLGYIDDADVSRYFFATDCVAVNYNDYSGISSVLFKAVNARRPILATDFGWIGYMQKKYNLGFAVRNDVQSIKVGLSKLFVIDKLQEKKSEEILMRHSEEIFKSRVSELFYRALC